MKPKVYDPCCNCGYSKPFPHGETGYRYGCRCEECKRPVVDRINKWRKERFKTDDKNLELPVGTTVGIDLDYPGYNRTEFFVQDKDGIKIMKVNTEK